MDKDVNELEHAINKYDEFRDTNASLIRSNIQNEMTVYKSALPESIPNDFFDLQVSQEINNKMKDFKENFDLKPKALYYDLKAKVELNEDISREELTFSAYSFLEQNTNNKLLKKIIKNLKKEIK